MCLRVYAESKDIVSPCHGGTSVSPAMGEAPDDSFWPLRLPSCTWKDRRGRIAQTAQGPPGAVANRGELSTSVRHGLGDDHLFLRKEHFDRGV